ncbi:hypothetical protein DYB36_000615 [Aphanomyces astaci]|uniref:Sfi1 spindle body domain-containing protein n=1 Tax=Aphanomyces astaci TaxID=112090 RepID=A0A397AFW7_APHAT|nr:hypothetical protein DYB36_000615 [Aphanomyces astaci]
MAREIHVTPSTADVIRKTAVDIDKDMTHVLSGFVARNARELADEAKAQEDDARAAPPLPVSALTVASELAAAFDLLTKKVQGYSAESSPTQQQQRPTSTEASEAATSSQLDHMMRSQIVSDDCALRAILSRVDLVAAPFSPVTSTVLFSPTALGLEDAAPDDTDVESLLDRLQRVKAHATEQSQAIQARLHVPDRLDTMSHVDIDERQHRDLPSPVDTNQAMDEEEEDSMYDVDMTRSAQDIVEDLSVAMYTLRHRLNLDEREKQEKDALQVVMNAAKAKAAAELQVATQQAEQARRDEANARVRDESDIYNLIDKMGVQARVMGRTGCELWHGGLNANDDEEEGDGKDEPTTWRGFPPPSVHDESSDVMLRFDMLVRETCDTSEHFHDDDDLRRHAAVTSHNMYGGHSSREHEDVLASPRSVHELRRAREAKMAWLQSGIGEALMHDIVDRIGHILRRAEKAHGRTDLTLLQVLEAAEHSQQPHLSRRVQQLVLTLSMDPEPNWWKKLARHVSRVHAFEGWAKVAKNLRATRHRCAKQSAQEAKTVTAAVQFRRRARFWREWKQRKLIASVIHTFRTQMTHHVRRMTVCVWLQYVDENRCTRRMLESQWAHRNSRQVARAFAGWYQWHNATKSKRLWTAKLGQAKRWFHASTVHVVWTTWKVQIALVRRQKHSMRGIVQRWHQLDLAGRMLRWRAYADHRLCRAHQTAAAATAFQRALCRRALTQWQQRRIAQLALKRRLQDLLGTRRLAQLQYCTATWRSFVHSKQMLVAKLHEFMASSSATLMSTRQRVDLRHRFSAVVALLEGRSMSSLFATWRACVFLASQRRVMALEIAHATTTRRHLQLVWRRWRQWQHSRPLLRRVVALWPRSQQYQAIHTWQHALHPLVALESQLTLASAHRRGLWIWKQWRILYLRRCRQATTQAAVDAFVDLLDQSDDATTVVCTAAIHRWQCVAALRGFEALVLAQWAQFTQDHHVQRELKHVATGHWTAASRHRALTAWVQFKQEAGRLQQTARTIRAGAVRRCRRLRWTVWTAYVVHRRSRRHLGHLLRAFRCQVVLKAALRSWRYITRTLVDARTALQATVLRLEVLVQLPCLRFV